MFCKAPFGFAVPASPTNETRGEGTGFACASHQQTKPEGAEGPFIISHGEWPNMKKVDGGVVEDYNLHRRRKEVEV